MALHYPAGCPPHVQAHVVAAFAKAELAYGKARPALRGQCAHTNTTELCEACCTRLIRYIVIVFTAFAVRAARLCETTSGPVNSFGLERWTFAIL
jgi:hypothetical protein